jgi:hypothetical protein
MPVLRKTNWDYGASKVRYRENVLILRQPRGFPIIPLKITLERARREAVIKASTKKHAGTDLDVYKNLEEVDKVVEEDDYGEAQDEDREEEEDEEEEDEGSGDSAYDSSDASANDSNDSAEPPATKVITEKPVALVDRRGRTRAATKQRKAQDASDSTMPTSVSIEDRQHPTVGLKKCRRSSTQAGIKST